MIFSFVLTKSDFSQANRQLEFWKEVSIMNASINFIILIWTKIISWIEISNALVSGHKCLLFLVGFFSKGRLVISKRDIQQERDTREGIHREGIRDNWNALPDVAYHGASLVPTFSACLFFLYWLYQKVKSGVSYLPFMLENIKQYILKHYKQKKSVNQCKGHKGYPICFYSTGYS